MTQLDGIGIAGYRSFGPQMERMGPFSKINVFAGQNNSGKSNVLRFIHDHLNAVLSAIQSSGKYSGFQNLDRHIGRNAPTINLEFGLKLDGHRYQAITDAIQDNRAKQSAINLLNSHEMTFGTTIAWFPYKEGGGRIEFDSKHIVDRVARVLPTSDWQYMWSKLVGKSGGDQKANWIPESLAQLSPVRRHVAGVVIVPAIRQIVEASPKDGDYSGVGIIQKLAELQHPELPDLPNRQRFDDINEFLRDVVGNRSAELEVPVSATSILVNIDDKTLPLSSLGTGIHEVIILAVAATTVTNKIVCMEEPEIHLHPALQRKLVRYLRDKTDNQYFIATHSAHLLDTTDTSVFHVELNSGESNVVHVLTAHQQSRVCVDLGYRPSDLVQSNCVIWVEGPSDRLYINYWLSAYAPHLFEGLHYSIMFYGGRLLRHLTADDPEVNEFISLRRINRRVCVIMDSDRAKPRARLNDTKLRIRTELTTNDSFVVVTQGREIENYLEPDIRLKAIQVVYPKANRLANKDRYARPLVFREKSGKTVSRPDKIKIARSVAGFAPEFDYLNLKKVVRDLSEFINASN